MKNNRKYFTLLSAAATLTLFLMAGPASAADAKDAGERATVTEGSLLTATFAGGCFWCMEPPFDKIDGVVSTTSGYTGGIEKNPTYREVSSGKTGHAEAVQVLYDPAKVSYEKLLDVFWHQINPTTPDRQFVDTGHQYRTAIFYHNDMQRRLAEESKTGMEESGRFDGPIVTEIVPAGDFWPAEDYHQDYYMKNPLRYKYYRFGSGRDQYLEKVWGTNKY